MAHAEQVYMTDGNSAYGGNKENMDLTAELETEVIERQDSPLDPVYDLDPLAREVVGEARRVDYLDPGPDPMPPERPLESPPELDDDLENQPQGTNDGREDGLNRREDLMNERESRLNDREDKLDEREDELDDREDELDQREEDLDDRETALNEKEDAYRSFTARAMKESIVKNIPDEIKPELDLDLNGMAPHYKNSAVPEYVQPGAAGVAGGLAGTAAADMGKAREAAEKAKEALPEGSSTDIMGKVLDGAKSTLLASAILNSSKVSDYLKEKADKAEEGREAGTEEPRERMRLENLEPPAKEEEDEFCR